VSVSCQAVSPVSEASAAVSLEGCHKEFALLLRCLGPVCTETDRDQIEGLLEAGLDWARLLESADHHGVTPFVYWRLAEADLHRLVPVESWTRLEEQFHANLRHNLFLMGQLATVLQAIYEAANPAVPFKGPALAQALWGNFSLRQCVDLDVLVPRKHVPAAMRVLHNLGYEPAIQLSSSVLGEHIRVASEMPLRKADPDVLLELQWDIAPRCFAVGIGMNEFWKRTAATDWNGMSMRTFAAEDLLLALCIHGWKHAWARLIWVSDVAQLIVQNPALDWRALLARAKECGVERILILGVSLAHELLGSPLPDALSRKAQPDAALRHLLDQARQGLSERTVVSYRNWHFFLLRARERWRDRLKHALRFVLTPGVPELTAVSLPRPLHKLYPVMRVVRLAKQLAAGS